MNSHDHHLLGGWRSIIATISAMFFFATAQPALADVTFIWIPVKTSATMHDTTGGSISITDAAYDAGQFSLTWSEPVFCGFTVCSAQPNSPLTAFYFWYSSPIAALDQHPTQNHAPGAFNQLSISATIVNGRLIGGLTSLSFQTDVGMGSDALGNWTIGYYDSDYSGGGCGLTGVCRGAEGYWTDSRVPAPATLALLAVGAFFGLSRRRKALANY